MARLLPASYKLGRLTFHVKEGLLRSDTDKRNLTPTEAAILRVFCESNERILTHEELFSPAWNEKWDLASRGKLDNQIGSLRKKSNQLGEPTLILTDRRRGLRLGVTRAACESDLGMESPLLRDYISSPELMTRFTIAGGLVRRSRAVIETPYPIELQAPFSELVWTNLVDGEISYLFVLHRSATCVAAKIIRMLLESARKARGDGPEEPVEQITSSGSFRKALARLRIVLVSRTSIVPVYIRNADNTLAAESFVYDIQRDRAIPMSVREVAYAQAVQLLDAVSDGDHRVIQVASSVANPNSVLDNLERDLTAECAESLSGRELPKFLDFILRPRKPVSSAALHRLDEVVVLEDKSLVNRS